MHGYLCTQNLHCLLTPLMPARLASAFVVPTTLAVVGIVIYSRRRRGKTHSVRIRSPIVEPSWSEHFINSAEAANCVLADSVRCGHSLLILHDLASDEECETLCAEAAKVANRQTELAATDKRRSWWSVPEAPGRMRLPIEKALQQPFRVLCDKLLLRAVRRVHERVEPLLSDVFGDTIFDPSFPGKLCATLTDNSRIEFSPREPAIVSPHSTQTFIPDQACMAS